ncbi:MAG: hypothetical protein VKJ06_04460 [Vampirovibrionales bacterium]|nr:hypothetical protein [Vampirovibrionales bacterium]
MSINLKTAQQLVQTAVQKAGGAKKTFQAGAQENLQQAMNKAFQQLPIDQATLKLKQAWHETEQTAWHNLGVAHFGPAFASFMTGSFALLLSAAKVPLVGIAAIPLMQFAAIPGAIAAFAGTGAVVNGALAKAAEKQRLGIPNNWCQDAWATINQLLGRTEKTVTGPATGTQIIGKNVLEALA